MDSELGAELTWRLSRSAATPGADVAQLGATAAGAEVATLPSCGAQRPAHLQFSLEL